MNKPFWTFLYKNWEKTAFSKFHYFWYVALYWIKEIFNLLFSEADVQFGLFLEVLFQANMETFVLFSHWKLISQKWDCK